MGGDDLCRTLVQQAGEPAQRGRVTRSSSPTGSTWRARSGRTGCAPGCRAGCDAWIVQREVQDVTQYAELWLRDSGDHRSGPGRSTPSGTRPGWTSSRRARPRPSASAGSRCASPRRPPREPVDRRRGVAAPGASSRSARPWRRTSRARTICATHDDAALLAGHFTLAAGGRAGAGRAARRGGSRACGAASEPRDAARDQGRRGRRGLRRACATAHCPPGRILDAIAQLMHEDPVLLRDRTPQAIRLLVEEGFLEPVPVPEAVSG